ncbi:MAG: peptide transporter ATPase [Ilumatobacteraceae bacterium]|nr:peptide transporter ATPase [Ilumatobacteraceae bacterium]
MTTDAIATTAGADGGLVPAVLEVDQLTVTFKIRTRPFRPKQQVTAVNQATFSIARGETLSLVGESGSGKSSTGRGILRLVPLAGGSVRLSGVDVSQLSTAELRKQRRHMQMIFQDPYSSLDPSAQVRDSIGEPLKVHEHLGGQQLTARVAELLDRVGLPAHYMSRYPYEFSGGQRQRVAIARAIALQPRLVICDEAVSALDVSTQNQVINLLEKLQDEEGLSYLFIAHDLGVVRHISDRVAVMYLGRIVEVGPAERVFESPAHPYTVALLSASPVPNPVIQRTRKRIILAGDLPDPSDPPSGCPFTTRCPEVMEICTQVMPPAVEVAGGGHVLCHLYDHVPPPVTPVAIRPTEQPVMHLDAVSPAET